MDKCMRGGLPTPPPKPPWLANRADGRTRRTEFFDIKESSAESSDDVHGVFGDYAEFDSQDDGMSDDGPPPNVPS